jgi:hypothetical protein
VLCGFHIDADTLPLLKQHQLLCWRWIFWSTAAFSASGVGYFGAQLHSVHQAWSGDIVVRCLEDEAMKSTRLHSISPTLRTLQDLT